MSPTEQTALEDILCLLWAVRNDLDYYMLLSRQHAHLYPVACILEQLPGTMRNLRRLREHIDGYYAKYRKE